MALVPEMQVDPLIGDEIVCKVCGETFLKENKQDHIKTFKHIEAIKRKFGDLECDVCKESIPKVYWNEHKKSKIHILLTRQMIHNKKILKREKRFEEKKRNQEEKDFKEETKENEIKTKEGSKEIDEEEEIEKEPKGFEIKTRFGEEEIEGKDEDVEKEDEIKKESKEKDIKTKITSEDRETKEGSKEYAEDKKKEKYVIREASGENQQYVDVLTTFLALRYALSKKRKDFKISVNNKMWEDFGDIIVEVGAEKTEIVAIRCKKVETRSSYTTEVLSAKSGNLSLKEQCEILKELRGNEGYENTSFKLYTMSSIILGHNPRFTYDSKTIAKWKEKDEETWKGTEWEGREIEIKQGRNSRKNNLLNTTNDPEDICSFQIVNSRDENLNNDLNKFCMFVNQKPRTDLEVLVKNMIKEKFKSDLEIADDLIEYVKKYFKTEKISRNKLSLFKMSKEDFLLKIAELLLSPFLVFPDPEIIKKRNLELWNATLQEFDVIIMKTNFDIMEKICSILAFILEKETSYVFNVFNEVTVDKEKIRNKTLLSKIFEDSGNDRSLRFMYLALWKSGLIPLILKPENEKQMTLILQVMSFLKENHVPLKYIISTDQPVHNNLPENLRVFLNLRNLKYINNTLLDEILEEEIQVLDLEVSLKDIVSWNKDFLEKLTPDALLNILLKDYSFTDKNVSMTEEIVNRTLVFSDEYINAIECYFLKRGHSLERSLPYLVNIKGQTSRIHLPPKF